MESARIASHLQSMPLFEGFSAEERQELAELLKDRLRRFKAGDVIFRQGDPPSALYIIMEGQVRERGIRDQREVFRRTCGPGDCLGRYAMVLDRPQRATARAVGNVQLLELSSKDFGLLLARHPELRERLLPFEVAGHLRAMPLFRGLSNEELIHVADLVEEHALGPQQVILRVEQREQPLYLIISGQVRLRAAGREEVLTAGNFFGGGAALREVRKLPFESAMAITPVELYALPADELRWLLKAYPALGEALERPDIVGRLRGTSIFAGLTDDQLRHLAGYVRWVHYPRGHMVTSQGRLGENFFILDRGEAVVRSTDELGRDRPIGYMREGESFGETSLFVGDPHDVSVEAATDTDWLILHRQDFQLAQADRPDIKGRLRLRPETERRLKQRPFSWLEPGEVVVEQIRRHPIIALRNLALPFLFALALLISLIEGRLPPPLGWSLMVLDALAGLWAFVDWWNDSLVITPRRVTRWERIWPVYEGRREAPLLQVQDVRVVRGLWGALLNFGRLDIQTAATEGLIEFTFTPDPMRVQRLILDRVARARVPERVESREVARRSLESRLDIGLELRAPPRAVPAEVQSGAASKPPHRSQRFKWTPWPWMTRVEDERITWRKHWIRLIWRTWLPLLVCGLLLYVAGLVYLGKVPFIPSGPAFWIAWLLITFLAFFWLWWEYTDWGNDVYIVTNERIIDVEKKPLFLAEERREASLGMVQNVNIRIPGPIAYILGFGDVYIYTAAEIGRFDFLFVPRPREVQAEIFRRIEAYKAREARRRAAQRQAEMADWFEMYHRFVGRQP